jgi:hypothetical protein
MYISVNRVHEVAAFRSTPYSVMIFMQERAREKAPSTMYAMRHENASDAMK